jgi:GT2 family glycosyltransferase
MSISIVIVNFNTGHRLQECISGLLKEESQHIEKIVIIDNDSTDSSEIISTNDNKILLIKNTINIGFASACNQAALGLKSEFILFLNPDTIMRPIDVEMIDKFLSSSEAKRIGAYGVQQFGESSEISRHCCRFPTVLHFIFLSLGWTRIFPKLGHVMSYWDHKSSRKVDHVIGSCYAIRTTLFHTLNGFDERFFLYYEDLDLSKRVVQKGWDIFYDSSVSIAHFCGASSKNVPVQRTFRSLQSKLLYVQKHQGQLQYYFLLLVNIVLELPLRSIFFGFTLKFRSLFNNLHAFLLLIFWVCKINKF